MNLTKKQVGELLKVLKNHESYRKALGVLSIENGYAYATDGYIAVKLETSVFDRQVDYTEIEKWYKLASVKDTLTDEALSTLPTVQEPYGYPQMEQIIPEGEPEPLIKVCLQPALLSRAATILGLDMPVLEFYGRFKPIVIKDNNDLALVMPCNK